MSLVPNYDVTTSESSSDSEIESDNKIASEEKPETKLNTNTTKLPTPGFISSNSTENVLTTSVFKNPFVEAENAKQAILEKHVKMVNANDNSQFLNGKKICWNYRKGRCRFGHNCKYAHDSDLQKSKEQLDAENQLQETVLCQSQPLAQPTVHEINQIVQENNAQKKTTWSVSGSRARQKSYEKLFYTKEVMMSFQINCNLELFIL
ncbi:hypothetical protein MML48_5g00012919 [Holotrichia oblita]|uniref:Uncharacterized protein n=1 Tax=Holotrichia oblita TaxID=644536 RepID=A0ACB9T1T9_HOLOL|nr:hypothetical protein MML48_5g00012919 [Holotrichia oblita]